MPFNIACGTCFFCSRGLTGNCENTNPNARHRRRGVFGYSHTTGGYDGGQAEYVRVPFADVGPMKIPDDMHEEDVLFLSDILPTGYQAAEMGDIKPGETVVVFGCGPVGLFAQKSAWLLGAGRVIAVDHLDYRLEFARALQRRRDRRTSREVDDVVAHLTQDDRRPRRRRLHRRRRLRGEGLAAADAARRERSSMAGSPTAINWAIDAVRKGGNVVDHRRLRPAVQRRSTSARR